MGEAPHCPAASPMALWPLLCGSPASWTALNPSVLRSWLECHVWPLHPVQESGLATCWARLLTPSGASVGLRLCGLALGMGVSGYAPLWDTLWKTEISQSGHKSPSSQGTPDLHLLGSSPPWVLSLSHPGDLRLQRPEATEKAGHICAGYIHCPSPGSELAGQGHRNPHLWGSSCLCDVQLCWSCECLPYLYKPPLELSPAPRTHLDRMICETAFPCQAMFLACRYATREVNRAPHLHISLCL